MGIIRFLRDHPITLGSILAGGFVSWVAYTALRSNDLPQPSNTIQPLVLRRALPPQPPQPQFPHHDPSRPIVVTPDLITKLQPGMARVVVEELIGQPPAAMVHPVSNVDGKLTYRASYLANLDPAQQAPFAAQGIPTPRSLIGIEYDASRPGHPLLKVYIPDPMS